MRIHIGDKVLELKQGDITDEHVDGIVNAANAALAGGGGVDGAIHRRGGPAIMAECRRIGGCPTGGTVATTAGALPAKRVLHTVGPIWRGGGTGEEELLASCYRSALKLAEAERLRSISFASISTGIYGYPAEKAAVVALRTIAAHLRSHDLPELVRMVLFDAGTYAAYGKALAALAPEGIAEE